MKAAPDNAGSLRCFIIEPVFGVGASSTEFPGALTKTLDRLDSTMRKLDALEEPLQQSQARRVVSCYTINWIVPCLEAPELDSDIRAVLTTMLQTAWDQYLSSIGTKAELSSDETTAVLEMLDVRGFKDLAQSGLALALQKWPGEPRLLALEAAGS